MGGCFSSPQQESPVIWIEDHTLHIDNHFQRHGIELSMINSWKYRIQPTIEMPGRFHITLTFLCSPRLPDQNNVTETRTLFFIKNPMQYIQQITAIIDTYINPVH